MKNKIKFSIIVPVYNVEKYLKECLTSLVNQTYKNYEVIIVNDGSTDNSRAIINDFNTKKFSVIEQKNQGLSSARNNGIKKAKGDYILFLDSDDYLDEKALEILSLNINGEDVIRFQLTEIDEDKKNIYNITEKPFNNLKGSEAFTKIVNFKYVENSWLYCYKTSFFKNNNFLFKENFYHEDFGLTPIILLEAKKVSCISECLYFYRKRKESIMNTKNKSKIQKKCNDLYKIGLENIEKISNCEFKSKKIILSYIANSLIIKGRELPSEDRLKYYTKLRQNNIFELMLKNTLKRKLKYIVAKYNYNLYLKVIK